jgi:murein DD-endopeptidase
MFGDVRKNATLGVLRVLSRCIFLLLGALTGLVGTARTEERTRFELPAKCQLGTNCWIANYVDVDAAVGQHVDFSCGSQTYDGHDGVDIAVRDAVAMRRGVEVLTAANGTVLRVRDGVEDREPKPDELRSILDGNRGCGNGVVIDHGSGWQTIYCHLKQGSVAVAPRQQVKAGDVIGKVGQSGAAEFPHLHFGVLRNGKKVDPFTGTEIGTKACGTDGAEPLWQAGSNIAYSPFSLYAAGFAPGAVDYEQIKKDAGTPDKLRRAELKVLSFWMVYFGAALGDRVSIEVMDPQGKVFVQHEFVQKKNRARQFFFTGKKAAGETLIPGIYTGKATVVREGATVLRGEMVKSVVLE